MCAVHVKELNLSQEHPRHNVVDVEDLGSKQLDKVHSLSNLFVEIVKVLEPW